VRAVKCRGSPWRRYYHVGSVVSVTGARTRAGGDLQGAVRHDSGLRARPMACSRGRLAWERLASPKGGRLSYRSFRTMGLVELLVLLPDATVEVTTADGRVLTSHPPPTRPDVR
jgi:hypothetical protein